MEQPLKFGNFFVSLVPPSLVLTKDGISITIPVGELENVVKLLGVASKLEAGGVFPERIKENEMAIHFTEEDSFKLYHLNDPNTLDVKFNEVDQLIKGIKGSLVAVQVKQKVQGRIKYSVPVRPEPPS